MRGFSTLLTIALLPTVAFACANDTPRAQTPTTTTGAYNTGTTATPGLDKDKATRAYGEQKGHSVGDVAPAPSTPTVTAPGP